jgi:hypothetical protein
MPIIGGEANPVTKSRCSRNIVSTFFGRSGIVSAINTGFVLRKRVTGVMDMTLKDFYNAVAAKADNDTQKIGAAEVSRVLSVAFGVLATHDAPTVLAILAKGLETAAKKQAKEAK